MVKFALCWAPEAMSQTVPFIFGPDTKPGKTTYTGDSRIINAFVEPVDNGKAGVRFAIHADPGLLEFVDFDEDSIRGHFLIGSNLYVVAGETLYKTTSGGATTEIGTVAGSGAIISAVNRNATAPQAVIVSGSNLYELQADVLQTFQDTDLPAGVISVDFIDTYFFFLLQSGIFYISGNNDTTVDALDFAEAEGRSDPGVRAFVYERRVWIFGTQTIEIWLDTGNASFPFERDSSFIERGCLSKHSIVAFDNTLAFVDDLGRVCKLQGYTPTVFSNPTVERDIRRTMTAQATDQIEGFVYFEAGHEFYVLSGPDWTWVYDASTQLWHQKKSYLSDRWIGRSYIRAFDKHLVGSRSEGILYEMSPAFLDEDGDFLIVEMNSPILGPWPARVSWHEVALDMEMGVGLTDGDDEVTAPQVMFSWSDDGGNTYGNERLRPLGAIGEYTKSLRFNRCGTSGRQGRCFKLKISAAVRRTVIQGSAQVEVLTA